MKRKLTLLLLLPAVFLQGCSQANFIDRPLEQPGGSPAKEEIVIWHTYSEEEDKLFTNVLIPEFESQHPSITVTSVRQPYNERLKDALISRSFSDRTPDLVRMDIVWVPDFAHLGLLYPVSRFGDFEEVKRNLLAPTLETNRYQDHYYGLPLNITAKIAIYNRQQLTESGLQAPPSTMAELRQAAAAHHEVLGMTGGTTWNYGPYFVSLGGQLLDETNSRASGYLNGVRSIQAVEQMKAMLAEGTFTVNYLLRREDGWGNVLEGKTLMIDEGPWFFTSQATSPVMRETLIHKTVAAPFPGKSIVGGENLVIMKNSRHLEAAWTFMKWMTGKEAEERMLSVGMIPTNTQAVLSEELQHNPFLEAVVQGLGSPYLRPVVPNWDAIDALFVEALNRILDGQVSVTEGLNAAAAKIDEVLRANK